METQSYPGLWKTGRDHRNPVKSRRLGRVTFQFFQFLLDDRTCDLIGG